MAERNRVGVVGGWGWVGGCVILVKVSDTFEGGGHPRVWRKGLKEFTPVSCLPRGVVADPSNSIARDQRATIDEKPTGLKDNT